MPEITKTKRVKTGDWRTLEWGWNASFDVRFLAPHGAIVKVRYGVGWLGWDSQKSTLNGQTPVMLRVRKASVARARVQMRVHTDADVTYTYIAV